MTQSTDDNGDNPFPSWDDKGLAGALRTHLTTVALLAQELRNRGYVVSFDLERITPEFNYSKPTVRTITKRIEL